ncbi:MAG: YdeI/OmpD-associated family protein [Woeseiaceae bacterium]|nr:YdeI/OmpD-associated family protein [Woeseiaceae bacterium]
MAKGIKTEKFEQVEVASRSALWDWLHDNHQQDESVWLVTFKKSVPDKYLSTDSVLDALIAYGWIDGVRRKLDSDRTMQLISRRKTQYWSKTYKDRADRLEQEGRMQEPGRLVIEESKRSGVWSFLDDVDALIIPEDLLAALKAHPPALETFSKFPPSAQRFALRDVKLAKTEATRRKRIDDVVSRAQRGELPRGVRMTGG